MRGRHYYLLTSLPALDELGSQPPLAPEELLAAVRELGARPELVEAVLLEQDLRARQGSLQEAASPGVVLSRAQMAGEEPLPAYLAVEPARRLGLPGDAVWEAYFRRLDALGRAHGSALLIRLAGFETALRNRLAVLRAARLNLDPEGYLLAEELASQEPQAAEAASAWDAAPDPLAAEKALDERRWRWLAENEPYFSFDFDEVLGYARRLLLLVRWRGITAAAERDKNRNQGSGGQEAP